MLATVALLGLSFVSYKGILEDHAKNAPGGKNSDALAGGAALDLLGLITLVQYGTILVSAKFYWLLLIIPVWGGWKIYTTFFGGGNKSEGNDAASAFPSGNAGGNPNSELDKAASERADAKRQKRAERRRQKWN